MKKKQGEGDAELKGPKVLAKALETLVQRGSMVSSRKEKTEEGAPSVTCQQADAERRCGQSAGIRLVNAAAPKSVQRQAPLVEGTLPFFGFLLNHFEQIRNWKD